MAPLSLVPDLKPCMNLWKIKVKIIRLWKQYSSGSNQSTEMIVIDSKGSKIHVTVKKDQLRQFETVLVEGATCLFYNFNVTQSTGSYRTTNHLYKIIFTSTTRAKICDDLPSTLSGFSPVRFEDILDGTLNTDILVDVIGQVVNISSMETVSAKGKDTKKISVEIRNERNTRLSIVLWGKFAEDVRDAIDNQNGDSFILVLKYGKIKIWQDKRSVSNAFNVSLIYINPDIPEVDSFILRLPKDNLELSVAHSRILMVSNGGADKEDFLAHTQRKTIIEVLNSDKVDKCIVLATISNIDSDMGWYYLSCKKCSKKVLSVPLDDFDEEETDFSTTPAYRCEKCNIDNPSILPRFKLHIVVSDDTGTSKFLLFDNLANQIIRQSASEIIGPIKDEMPECYILPTQITSLIGKKFLFKISIEKENYVYKYDTYKVVKLITNEDIISEFTFTGSLTNSSSIQKDSTETIDNRDSNISYPSEGSLSSGYNVIGSPHSITDSSTPNKRMKITNSDSFDCEFETSATKRNDQKNVK